MMRLRQMTGGEAVIETLQANGVEVIFGIPGGHSLAVYDAIAGQDRIRHVLGRHEQGLGFMADGYSRASGKIGVLSTTSGPAVANLACALGSATTDTSSVLAISSTVRSDMIGKNRGGLHDLGEAIDIVRPVCRQARRCLSVEEIPATLSEIIYRLKTERPGAAFCEIPVDILGARAEVEIPEPKAVERPKGDPSQLEAAVRLLSTAQRPIIWAGTGAALSGAGVEIDRLAARLGAIVVPTTLGRGVLPSDHPNVVTCEGAFPSVMDCVIAEADVVLAVGTMFKQEDTVAWGLKMGQKLIHIDIDPAEMGRSYEPDVAVVADAKAALAAILAELPERAPADSSWVAKARKAQDERLRIRRERGPLETGAVDVLRNSVPRDGFVFCDRCNLGYWAYICLPAYAPKTFQYPMGYGQLGGALPQAFGAKIACPDKVVVSVLGDGGFQFTGTELAVGVQENIPVTVVICNNGIYGAIGAYQQINFGRKFGHEIVNPDFQQFAAAYGIPAVRADDLPSFQRALDEGIKSNRLNIIEMTAPIRDPAE